MIWSPSISMNIQIVGRKITEILGIKTPLGKVKNSLSFFLFICKFFSQNWVSLILTIFWYLVLLFRNQIKHVENVCLYQYLICKTRYSKMAKNKDMQFFMENLKMNRKRTKKIDLPERKFEPQIFSNFPTHNLNFHGRWRWRDQI